MRYCVLSGESCVFVISIYAVGLLSCSTSIRARMRFIEMYILISCFYDDLVNLIDRKLDHLTGWHTISRVCALSYFMVNMF